MQYVTEATIRAHAPIGFIDAVSRNLDGQTLVSVLETANLSAVDLIHGYVGGRYTIPFSDPIPAGISNAVCWLTLWVLAGRLPVMSAEYQIAKNHHDDIMAWLRRIADGGVQLTGAASAASDFAAVIATNAGDIAYRFIDDRTEGGSPLANFGINKPSSRDFQSDG